jgi:hypothetical protein
MWVYLLSEPHLWTVGFYDPAGKWHSDSDHSDREQAAKRVAWLNGLTTEKQDDGK